MKKVLWFSQHTMSKEQSEDLKRIYGKNIEINQINRTINNVAEIKEEIERADVLAIVAPINLQAQFLKAAKDKPVIATRNKRVFADGKKVEFIFDGWYQILKIDVVTKDL